jgi:hypothetical protein
VENTIFNVKKLIQKPLTNTHSRAMTLHTIIGSMTLGQIKGIACKIGIKITGKKKHILVSSIVKKLWFDKEPQNNILTTDFILTTDLNYYKYLDRMICGENNINSWNEYITNMRNFDYVIQLQMRNYNLRRLNRQKDYYERMWHENTSMFIIESGNLTSSAYIVSNFGLNITLEDIIRVIPMMRIGIDDEMFIEYYLNNRPNGEFEDVVHEQKLDLTCEYVKDIKKTEEECMICYSDTKCDTILNCGHMYCIDCVVTNVKMVMNDHRKKLTCPMCRTETKYIRSNDDFKIENLANLLR